VRLHSSNPKASSPPSPPSPAPFPSVLEETERCVTTGQKLPLDKRGNTCNSPQHLRQCQDPIPRHPTIGWLCSATTSSRFKPVVGCSPAHRLAFCLPLLKTRPQHWSRTLQQSHSTAQQHKECYMVNTPAAQAHAHEPQTFMSALPTHADPANSRHKCSPAHQPGTHMCPPPPRAPHVPHPCLTYRHAS
jgi:hypothetical protein